MSWWAGLGWQETLLWMDVSVLAVAIGLRWVYVLTRPRNRRR